MHTHDHVHLNELKNNYFKRKTSGEREVSGVLLSVFCFLFSFACRPAAAQGRVVHVFLFFEKKTLGLSLMGSGEGACFGA
jgi:hypothetical protein